MNIQEIMPTIINGLIRIPMVLICIVIHEIAHGFMAYKMGDDTAKRAGRLSFNPLKHIDIVGAASMLLFNFGWAKAVPVNPYRFRNRRKGMILVSLAGPVANILFAFLLMIIMYLMAVILPSRLNSETYSNILSLTYYIDQLYVMNLCLAVFNLIPIPPLDGSKIIGAFLPEEQFRKLMQYEHLGMIALLVLVAFSERFDVLGKILNFGVTIINNILLQLSQWLFYFVS